MYLSSPFLSNKRSSPAMRDVCISQSSGHTEIKMWKSSYTWTIENFSLCPRKTGQSLESPKFRAGPNNELQWQLELYPVGVSDKFHECVSVFLKLVSSSKVWTRSNFEISFLNDSGKKLNSRSMEGLFGVCCSLGFKDFVPVKMLRLPSSGDWSDVLVVRCELTAASEVNSANDTNSIALTALHYRLSDKLLNLLHSETLSDVTVKCKNATFRAHASLLAASSEKFAAIFAEQNFANRDMTVDMRDFDFEVVKEIFFFMYGGKIPHFSEQMTEDILAVAEKFGVTDLKGICEEVMISKLKVENAARALMVASTYDAKRLKQNSMEFILKNVAQVMDTEAWKLLSKKRPQLVDEVAKCLAMHLVPPSSRRELPKNFQT